MLQLIQSNSMEALVHVFVERARETTHHPFEPQTVVVQSYGMGQWLRIRQAEQLGIAANIDCLLPANLVWRLYQRILTDLPLPTESPYSIERLTWHLMKRFPDCSSDEFAPVQQFLQAPGDPQIRAWQLAEKIATLFDQYLIYRPEWIAGWEAGHDEPGIWQGQLWRMLLEEPSLAAAPHRARLHRALIERIETLDALPEGVPTHLSVLGLSTLPPIHLEALHALSRLTDIDIYLLNPCRHYWGDVVSEKDVARRSIRRLVDKEALVEEDYLEVGNPLLSSWGKQGREFLELLLDIPALESAEFFDDAAMQAPDPLLLTRIKADILDLSFGGEFGASVTPVPQPVREDDRSVQVHVCHSRMREVEVLNDQLLAMFDADSTLEPSDIIVMMPDVSKYAPFIDAEFPGDRMPYTIADRSAGSESPVLLAFLTLLGLPDSRLTSTWVMDLLEVPTIARRFELTDDDLLRLSRWIRDTNIRWELDGSTKAERWQVPPEKQNTWRFGLDRLLLGFAMEQSAGIFDGILPFDVDGTDAPLLARLSAIIELLADWRHTLSEPHTAAEWQTLLLRVADDFFAPVGDEELDLAHLRELMIQLETETDVTGYKTALSPQMLRHWLTKALSISQQSRGFISGGITFATLVPMRSIPFRAVCLIGMNDGEYPREDRPPTFDLMQREGFRRGDRSKRNDDRYLFLEALISATDYFYVSYEGRTLKDNKARPPSVLVGELIDYLDRAFEHDVITEHPLQPFSEEYFMDSRPKLITYRGDWFAARTDGAAPLRFAADPLGEDPELSLTSLDQLRQFFRYPARTFMRERLGVYLEDRDDALAEAESFEQDGLDRFQLTQHVLAELSAGHGQARIEAEARARGDIAPGDIGAAQLARSVGRAQTVIDAVNEIASGEPARVARECELGNGIVIEGAVDNVYGDVVINARAAMLRKRQVLDAWIEHLFINAVSGPVTTQLIWLNSNDREKRAQIMPIDENAALSHLRTLASLRQEGMRQPLPFLPELSYLWYTATLERESREQVIEAALAEWQTDDVGREGSDTNYQRVFSFPDDFDDNFDRLASDVYAPLLDRLKGKI